MKKVIAVQSLHEGDLKYFGEGEYLGDLVPDVEPFNRIGLKNPCIQLDSGEYVWGFQCWWAEKVKFMDRYKQHIKSVTLVKLDSVVEPVANEKV